MTLIVTESINQIKNNIKFPTAPPPHCIAFDNSVPVLGLFKKILNLMIRFNTQSLIRITTYLFIELTRTKMPGRAEKWG